MTSQTNKSYDFKNNIFCPINKYGYRLNVNHPMINDLLRRYKKWKNLRYNDPLFDKQRFEFEDYVMGILPPVQT